MTRLRCGWYYVVKEWDDSQTTVELVGIKGPEVLMRYEDGVVHRVTRRYFRSRVVFVLSPDWPRQRLDYLNSRPCCPMSD